MESPLIGRWRLVRTEEPAELTSVELEFRPDGSLQCSMKQADGGIQVINLTYEVSGDTIISDQPSAPLEATTHFAIDAAGELELNFGGIRSWYERVG